MSKKNTTTTATIRSIEELAIVLSALRIERAGGHYCTIVYEKPIDPKNDLRVNATDGSGLKLDKSRPLPFKRTTLENIHFAQSYFKTAQKVYGEDYKPTEKVDKEILVPYLLYRNIGSGKYVMPVIIQDKKPKREWLCSAEELAYFEHFFPAPRDKRPIEYLTVGVAYITSIEIDHKIFLVDIPNLSVKRVA